MRYLLLIFLTSCTLGPHFYKPDVETPSKWTASQDPLTSWWESFEDPLLTELIEESLISNADLQIAQMRLCKARLERKKALSARWPRLGLNFDAARIDLSDDFPLIASNQHFDFFEAGFDATWEVDLFGKMRRGKEALDALVGIEEEKLHMTQLSLIVEIARNYFDLCHAQNQIALIEELLLLQVSLYEDMLLLKNEELSGNGPNIEIAQEIEKMESKLSQMQTEAQLIKNRLAFLVNGLPGSLDQKLQGFHLLPHCPTPTIGLPSTLLCRRPDIRLAEQMLALQIAEVGISMSNFLPKFDLLGNIGTLSTILPRLFQSQTYTDLFNFLAKVPLFEGGKLVAQLKIAKTEEQEALLNYTKAALGAFHEVDAALMQYEERRLKVALLTSFMERGAKLVENALLLEKEELASHTLVKQQKIKYIESKSEYLRAKAGLLEQALSLYKSLGGGWELY